MTQSRLKRYRTPTNPEEMRYMQSTARTVQVHVYLQHILIQDVKSFHSLVTPLSHLMPTLKAPLCVRMTCIRLSCFLSHVSVKWLGSGNKAERSCWKQELNSSLVNEDLAVYTSTIHTLVYFLPLYTKLPSPASHAHTKGCHCFLMGAFCISVRCQTSPLVSISDIERCDQVQYLAPWE